MAESLRQGLRWELDASNRIHFNGVSYLYLRKISYFVVHVKYYIYTYQCLA